MSWNRHLDFGEEDALQVLKEPGVAACVALSLVETSHFCVEGFRDLERESIPRPPSRLCWGYVGSRVRGFGGAVTPLLPRRARLTSTGWLGRRR